ncbi:hypothetical protein IOD16_21950 [Saccharothrix sp. 6-C]|uniref:hypothetical protein n=1 Tax=Saccharothrix sp. 6-C TaxID=2781735 RepID=UPI001916D25D|nr:hypothetical protein [Saccharothrix sp. 6-C]QQQ73904.1 hypothetical protein IOD16_21950 [Saccharothrix sp. 6-C]
MKSRGRPSWANSVVLVAALIGCGTAGCTPAGPEPGAAACAPFSLGPEVYAEVGELGSVETAGSPSVVVLDEQHASRAGQVELAIMLNRLYHGSGLRHLALEGSVVEQPQPSLDWFTSLPDAGIRRAVALQLLEQGEVGAAEFAAMVLPDFRLHAIEHEEEYRVGLSGEDQQAYTGYLTAIALTTMTTDQIGQATALLEQDKHEEGIQFVIDTNPWTSERRRLLERKSPIVSSGEMQRLGDELEEKARQVGADVTRYQDGLRKSREFFDAGSRRSTTMTANTADIAAAQQADCAPIALNVGAAHSPDVVADLTRRGLSHAVVSPSNLSLEWANGSLSSEAFHRKVEGGSVDPAGALGAILDGRRKPPPTSQQDWFKAKAQLAYATVVIARAAAAARTAGGGGGKPPFNLDRTALGLGGEGPGEPRVSVDLSTIDMPEDGLDHVVFKATLNDRHTDVWVKAGIVAPADDPALDHPQSLEQALKDVLRELRESPPATEPQPSGKPQAVAVIPGLNAAVAKTRDEVLTAAI